MFGITGGSGSGKSYISDIFREYGYYIIDADKIGHEIIKSGKPAYFELIDNFGKDITSENGEIDRKKLGQIVFSDKKSLMLLNSITHPHIRNEIYEISRQKGKITGVDGALLFECNIECSPVIGVIADKNVRIERIIKRDGISKESALNRINSQKSDDFYISQCDFIINNNPEENIREQINKILSKIN